MGFSVWLRYGPRTEIREVENDRNEKNETSDKNVKGVKPSAEDKRIQEVQQKSDEELNRLSARRFSGGDNEYYLAELELQRRRVAKEVELTQENIDASKTNVTLSKRVLWCSLITLGMVGIQTWISWGLFVAQPDLDAQFVNRTRQRAHSYTYDLRVSNTGWKYAEGAYLHLWVPNGLKMTIESGHTWTERKLEKTATHYQWDVDGRIMQGRHAPIATVSFKFRAPTASQSVQYLVISASAPRKEGEFFVRDDDYVPASKVGEADIVAESLVGRETSGDATEVRG